MDYFYHSSQTPHIKNETKKLCKKAKARAETQIEPIKRNILQLQNPNTPLALSLNLIYIHMYIHMYMHV